MSARALAAAAAVFAAGCAEGSQEQLARADDVARAYLRAAANGDAKRLCAMRTRGALSALGGRAACEHRPPGVEVFHRRKLSAADLTAAKVLPEDTSADGTRARVVVDYGEAVIDSGHAVSGKILEFDLRMEGGRYKVGRVGAAVFVD
jgi:hypothetical protein